ncbi:MAG: LysE family translocator [Campylobacterota bacterium]
MFSFFLIALLLALTPGPDNLYLLHLSIQKGKKSGIIFTLGLCSGLVVHTALAVLGISAFVLAQEMLFTLLQFAGSLYLLYLAFDILRSATPPNADKNMHLPKQHVYTKGVIMNLSNPKILVFFLAFLPGFIDTSKNVTLQTIALGVVFIAATMLIFFTIAFLAHRMRRLLQAPLFFKLMHYLSAAIFVILAFLALPLPRS